MSELDRVPRKARPVMYYVWLVMMVGALAVAVGRAIFH
jgi:hypothetical protein